MPYYLFSISQLNSVSLGKQFVFCVIIGFNKQLAIVPSQAKWLAEMSHNDNKPNLSKHLQTMHCTQWWSWLEMHR